MPTERIRAAIVGGGIGGLAAANALVRRGIDVTVFEQAPALGEVGAGIFIYPNSLRQLERMGLGEPLAAVGAKVGDGSEYYRMDGTVVGQIPHHRLERLERPLWHASGRSYWAFSRTPFLRRRYAPVIAASALSRTLQVRS